MWTKCFEPLQKLRVRVWIQQNMFTSPAPPFLPVIYDRPFQGGTSEVVPLCYMLCPCVYGPNNIVG